MRACIPLILLIASLATGCATKHPELHDLMMIHNQVAARFTYTRDIRDEWVIPKPGAQIPARIVGDCDEFALWVRHLAREKGIPVRLMFVRAGLQRRGHIVAEWAGWIVDQYGITTNRGSYYQYVSINGPPGQPWRKVTKLNSTTNRRTP